jgi:hypothetical protein
VAVVVTLGALTIGDDPADANGAYWDVKAVEGWDSPELRSSLLSLPGEDRQAIGPLRYNARALSVVGECVVPSEAAYWLSLAKIMAATELTRASGTLTLTETVTKKIDVYRAGRVLWRPVHSLLRADFEIPLTAPDPRKLANTATTLAGAGTATNTGNFAASPTLTVTGAAAGPIVIANTTAGKTITISTAVPGGQQLVVNFRARTILLNGVSRYDLVAATPQWFDIAPGNNTITYSGGGTPSLSWNDSWI